MTLLRFVRGYGWAGRPRSRVRVAESQPGDVAEIDYGRMGMLPNPLTGKRQVIWALVVVVVLPFGRHSFVWPTTRQTLDATIEGLEAAWQFFTGIPRAWCSTTFQLRPLDAMHSSHARRAAFSNTARRAGSCLTRLGCATRKTSLAVDRKRDFDRKRCTVVYASIT